MPPDSRLPDDMPSVGIEVLPHAAGLPPLAAMTGGAAGYDLRAALASEVVIEPGRAALVPAGIRLEIPAGYEGQVRSRSGLAWRDRIAVLNGPGTIDSDYRGEICVLLYNFGEAPFRIQHGDRIAQLVFARVHRPHFEPRTLGATERAAGGFGSTGSA